MNLLRNIKARSCHHCCSGKAISISYYECVLVALGIQHAMRLRHIVICGLPALQYFSTLSKKGTIFEPKKKLFNMTVCFDFICNTVTKFLTVSTNERDTIKNVYWSSCEVLIIVRF